MFQTPSTLSSGAFGGAGACRREGALGWGCLGTEEMSGKSWEKKFGGGVQGGPMRLEARVESSRLGGVPGNGVL